MDGTEGREEREAGEGFCLACLGDLCVLLFNDSCCFEMLAEEFLSCWSRLMDGLFTEGVEGWMEQKVAKSAKPGKGFAWHALAIFACFCLMIHVVLKCWPKSFLSCWSRLMDGLFTEGVEGWMEQKVAKSAKPGKGFAWHALVIFACFCLMIHVVLKCWPKSFLSCWSRLMEELFTEGVEGWMEQKVAKSAKPGKGFAWYALAIFACFCLMIHVVLKCWPKSSLSCSAGGVAVEIGSTGTRKARKISRH